MPLRAQSKVSLRKRETERVKETYIREVMGAFKLADHKSSPCFACICGEKTSHNKAELRHKFPRVSFNEIIIIGFHHTRLIIVNSIIKLANDCFFFFCEKTKFTEIMLPFPSCFPSQPFPFPGTRTHHPRGPPWWWVGEGKGREEGKEAVRCAWQWLLL